MGGAGGGLAQAGADLHQRGTIQQPETGGWGRDSSIRRVPDGCVADITVVNTQQMVGIAGPSAVGSAWPSAGEGWCGGGISARAGVLNVQRGGGVPVAAPAPDAAVVAAATAARVGKGVRCTPRVGVGRRRRHRTKGASY